MGHTRLGRIPKTQKWAAVVAAVGNGHGAVGVGLPRQTPQRLASDVRIIAQRTLEAAEGGLARAADDPGLRFTFYLLTQVVLAAREPDWKQRLAPLGMSVPAEATLFDLTVEFGATIDSHLRRSARPTDVSEMAARAGGEALAGLAGPRVATLFGSTPEDLRLAVRDLSTRNGFAELSQRFFGRFMARFLNFYLSRVTASAVGGEKVQGIGDVSAFNEALEQHCYQSARIVRDFAGDWYSSREFHEGINLGNTSAFMARALQKLRAELAQQQDET